MIRPMRCSKCKKLILRQGKDEAWKLSSRVLKVEDEYAPIVAVCRSCGSEQPLPIRFEFLTPGDDKKSGLVIHVNKET